MFAAERLKIIEQYLKSSGHLEVTTISAMLGVSEVTIRRDLERLEREGILIRTHGGAVMRKIQVIPQPLHQSFRYSLLRIKISCRPHFHFLTKEM